MRRLKAPSFSIVLVLVAIAVAGIYLGLGARESTAAASEKIIHIGNYAEPKDLDPHVVTGVYERSLLTNLYEPLMRKDGKTLAVVPGVAEKYTLSKDGKVYTFTLRKDAKWSNGEPVTAQDFVYGITRLLEPSTAAEYAYMGHWVKNGKAYNEGKLKDASQLGLKALSPTSLQITLESPAPFFPSLLDHYTYYPIHKASVEKHGRAWTKPGNIVTNGPFTLVSWETNKKIVMRKNPLYFDKDKVQLEEAHFYPVENSSTEEKMFRSGQLHVTYEVPPEKLDAWVKDKTGVYYSVPQLATYHFKLNVTKPPLSDKRVRKALALGTDRSRITQFVSRGGEEPLLAFTPPGTGQGYTPTPHLAPDASRLEEAKKLLAEAGYSPGKKMPAVEILFDNKPLHKKIAEALQQMWKENLGIEVTLVNQEWKVYLNSMKTLSYSIARFGWVADYNDPYNFLELMISGGGNNLTGWSNKEFDKLLDASTKERNNEKRNAILKKAEDVLLDEMPIIPLYVWTRHYLKQNSVDGWDPNVEDNHPLKYVSLTNKTKSE